MSVHWLRERVDFDGNLERVVSRRVFSPEGQTEAHLCLLQAHRGIVAFLIGFFNTPGCPMENGRPIYPEKTYLLFIY